MIGAVTADGVPLVIMLRPAFAENLMREQGILGIALDREDVAFELRRPGRFPLTERDLVLRHLLRGHPRSENADDKGHLWNLVFFADILDEGNHVVLVVVPELR